MPRSVVSLMSLPICILVRRRLTSSSSARNMSTAAGRTVVGKLAELDLIIRRVVGDELIDALKLEVFWAPTMEPSGCVWKVTGPSAVEIEGVMDVLMACGIGIGGIRRGCSSVRRC